MLYRYLYTFIIVRVYRVPTSLCEGKNVLSTRRALYATTIYSRTHIIIKKKLIVIKSGVYTKRQKKNKKEKKRSLGHRIVYCGNSIFEEFASG